MPYPPGIGFNGGSDPLFTTLTEGQMAKADATGKLIYAGATVNPSTGKAKFDNGADVGSGSLDLGPASTLSEASKQLAISNNVDGTHGYVKTTDFDETGSFASKDVDLKTQVFNPLQTDDTQVITTNPLNFVIIGGVQAPKVRQTNQVTFRADAPMANVVAKITDNASGVVIRFIPNEAAFNAVTPEEVAANPGLPFITGDNIVDFVSVEDSTPGVFNIGLSTFQLRAGQQLDVELKADSMSLKGTVTDIPFLTQLIQEGLEVDTLVNDAEKLLLDTQVVIQNADQTSTTPVNVDRVDIYVADGLNDTVASGVFIPGVDAVSNPSVTTVGSGIFTTNQFVLFRGFKQNNGLYEVGSHIGTDLVVRGVGTGAMLETFTLDQFVAGTDSGTITRVIPSVWRSAADGTPQHGEGDMSPITFHQLAHASDVPIIASETFASKDAMFDAELGLPSAQGWTDTETGAGTITLITDTVFGVETDVVKYNIPGDLDVTKSRIALSAGDWGNNLINGFSFRGVRCRITEDINTQSIFSGMGFSGTNDPRISSIQSRVGIFISEDGTNTTIRLDGQATIALDGTAGVPLVPIDTYFDWEVFGDPSPDSGLSFGAAILYVNDKKVVVGGIVSSNNAVNDEVSVANSSSSGSTTFYFVGFGVTIYEEGSVKILSAGTMAADIRQIFRPEGKRNHTVVVPDGNPSNLGNRLDLIGGSAGTQLTLKTENTAAPQSLFNGLNELVIDVISRAPISFINTLEVGNVYLGEFESEEDIIYDHSGLISTGDNGGPKGMSILNATTFRVETLKSVIVDRSLNTRLPKQTFFDLPQIDHVITGGGDQVINTYINNQGVHEFRTDEPTSFSVTGETFIGKSVMAAGVITVAVFTPVVAYTGSVDGQAELINGGGHKTKGSILSPGGADLSIGVTPGSHHQIGRGMLPDPNSPNLCETEARAKVAFTGTTGNLFLVHADSGGSFVIDAFISNSATPFIDPSKFNSGGTIVTVPTNRFSAQRVFQACGTEDIIIYYGTTTYANVADAEAGFEGENPELLTTRDISYICTILVKETVTDLEAGVIAGTVIFKNRSGDREL